MRQVSTRSHSYYLVITQARSNFDTLRHRVWPPAVLHQQGIPTAYTRALLHGHPPPSLKICTHAFLILRRTLSTNRRAPRCIIHQPHFLFSVPQSWGEVWGGGSDLLLFGNCNLSLHLTDRREQKSSLFLKKGGEAAQALNTYTIKFWHSFQDKSPQKQQKM